MDSIADTKSNEYGERQMSSKNVPTNPKLWAKAQAAAKRKYAVHPSAYSNSFAAKKYRAEGGKWKKAKSK